VRFDWIKKVADRSRVGLIDVRFRVREVVLLMKYMVIHMGCMRRENMRHDDILDGVRNAAFCRMHNSRHDPRRAMVVKHVPISFHHQTSFFLHY
jgi:hypothetical protein